MDWAKIWESIKTFFTTNIWNIVKFFAVLIIGIIIVKILLNLTRRIMKKTKLQEVAQGFLFHILRFTMYLILTVTCLNIIGISMSGVVTAISAAVLAIGMALQSLIANLANGIIIVSTSMFKKGDYISVDGVEGSLDDVNFLFITLITPDNKKITLPNSSVVNSPVVNYSAKPTRKVSFEFEVAYESDVEQVKNIVLDVMKNNGKVYLEPKAPFCRLKILGASSITFVANCWADAEDYWDVYYDVIENVFNELKRNNISIPYNQLEIRERKDNVVMPVIEAKPERVEKVRTVKRKLFDLENDDLMSVFKIKKHTSNKDAKPKKEKKDKKDKKNQGNETNSEKIDKE